MTPCLTPQDLDALFHGSAPTEAQRRHALECAVCSAALREATAATESEPATASVSAAGVAAVPVEEPGRYRRVLVDGQPTLLGAGGYARVELARDEVIGRDVALKTLRSAQLASPRRHVTERRLLQEARVVGQLEHPAIVPLYDLARTAGGELFYAMRRIRGRTLAAAIREAGALEGRLRLLPHVLAACHAVAYAHSRGVVHRDLKPHNVMVDRFGETMVIDWGLARTKHDEDESVDDLETSGALRLVGGDETLSDGRGRLGTPAYMSPEQLTGVRALIDEKSDVFGLGGILFEVLTGRAPREDGPLQEAPRRVLTVDPAVPADLAALCDKALEASRDTRYQSAEELARDLDAWLHGDRVTAHAYRPAELVRRFVRQHRVTLAVGLGAVVALLAVGIAGAVRTRVQRDQARSFALLLAGDTLHRLPFAPRDPFRQQLAARVSQYLASSDETDDPTQAAEAWEHLATEHSSSGRTAEARAAASRCLALLPLPVRDERAEAVELTCRLTLIDRTDQPFEERYRHIEQLWAQRRTPSPLEPRLLFAQEALALSLAELSTNTSRLDDARSWAALGIEWGQHLTRLQPDDAEAWSLLAGAHYMQQVNEMNAVHGPAALEHARRAVEGAQRSHVLAHSPQSLLRLADMLSDQYATQGIYPELVTPAEHEATAKEAAWRFEALLALDDSAPLVKRRYAEFLLARGDVERGWAVVAAVPIADFFFQRPQLWLAFVVGQLDFVLAELAREGGDAFDHHVLLALAHVVKGDHAAAAAHARQAAGASFESFWPGLAMTRWAAKQTGPRAPALSTLTAELTEAQRTNDEARAHRALEGFAAALEP